MKDRDMLFYKNALSARTTEVETFEIYQGLVSGTGKSRVCFTQQGKQAKKKPDKTALFLLSKQLLLQCVSRFHYPN